MKRFPAQLLFIIFLAGFGVSFGIDQAAKHDGKDPGAIHRSYLPEVKDGKEKGRSAAEQAGSWPAGTGGSGAAGGGAGSGKQGVGTVGAGAESGGYQQAGSAEERTNAAGSDEAADGQVKESFMNKLGTKLGEVVRMAAGAVVGLFVSLANSVLH